MQTAGPSRRFGNLWYAPVQEGPTPQELAARLREASAHRAAVRRIDDFERFQHQRDEAWKAKVKLGIGALAVVLGTAPGIPGTIHACPTDPGWLCGLRVGAIVGSCMALGVSIWAAAELLAHPVHFHEQVEKLNAELRRTLQARGAHAAPEDIFSAYRRFTPGQRAAFREELHEAAGEPKHSFANAARAVIGV